MHINELTFIDIRKQNIQGEFILQLSIVIPVHNEQENIRSLVNEIKSHLEDKIEYELIYVDDGSNDNTFSELTALQTEGYAQLRVLRHNGCFGQSASVLTGIRNARADWIVTLDGDGQNDPVDILPIYQALLDANKHDPRYQCAAGYRKKRNDSTSKRWSSLIANNIRARLLHDDTPDTGCGLKAMQRSAFLALPFFDHVHRFIPALIKRNGGEVIIVEVNHRHRTAGTSKYGIANRLWVGIVDLIGVKWLCARKKNPVCYAENTEKQE